MIKTVKNILRKSILSEDLNLLPKAFIDKFSSGATPKVMNVNVCIITI